MNGDDLKKYIRDVADFPKKGIVFRDITTLLMNTSGFRSAVNLFIEEFKDKNFNKIAAIESRGFILGGALANILQKSLILVRKPGKLPAKVVQEEYELEYGKDTLEIHEDAVESGDRIVVIDDLLATGGTALATCRLVERLGGKVVCAAFLIELSFLNGREKIRDYPVCTFIDYKTE